MYELIVIGAGPAGLAAAIAAWEHGLRKIAVIERDCELGGILNQCIHNGFGLHHFKEELTGPEYAGRFIDMLASTDIEVMSDTMVTGITDRRQVTVMSAAEGYRELQAQSIILAMGCRERTRGAISIPGTRPAGVLTAGAAQRYVNIDGQMVGRRVVILGSGDIGLIMARRMTLEGAKVLACVELMPYSGGLNRNIVQCLNDFDIPLYLSHTITDIRGDARVEGVTISKVDESRRPIPGTEKNFDCDTVLLSVGLIPENEISREAGIEIDPRTNGPIVFENMETSAEGIFACGNAVHVHDLVDFVTAESTRAGIAAAQYVKGQRSGGGDVLSLKSGDGVTYTVPQKIRRDSAGKLTDIFFRAGRVYSGCTVAVDCGGQRIAGFRREHLAPGEMEHIVIPKVLLDKASGEITVSIEEDAQ